MIKYDKEEIYSRNNDHDYDKDKNKYKGKSI